MISERAIWFLLAFLGLLACVPIAALRALGWSRWDTAAALVLVLIVMGMMLP